MTSEKIVSINKITDLSKLICSLCYCILKSPLECFNSRCKKLFCKECFEKSTTNKKPCPFCRSEKRTRYIDDDVYQTLKSLQFSCENNLCCTPISYSDFDTHAAQPHAVVSCYTCKSPNSFFTPCSVCNNKFCSSCPTKNCFKCKLPVCRNCTLSSGNHVICLDCDLDCKTCATKVSKVCDNCLKYGCSKCIPADKCLEPCKTVDKSTICPTCSCCIDTEDTKKCNYCKTFVCNECIRNCQVCKKLVCVNDCNICEKCGRLIGCLKCTSSVKAICTAEEENCKVNICTDCWSFCNKCDKLLCSDHSSKCIGCEEYSCAEHKHNCEICQTTEYCLQKCALRCYKCSTLSTPKCAAKKHALVLPCRCFHFTCNSCRTFCLMCKDLIIDCDACSPNYFSYKCETCEGFICKNCAKLCSTCGIFNCPIDNEDQANCYKCKSEMEPKTSKKPVAKTTEKVKKVEETEVSCSCVCNLF